MSKFMVYSALAVALMAEGTFCVPICAQEKVVQTMTRVSRFLVGINFA